MENRNQNIVTYAMTGGLILGLSLIACMALSIAFPYFSIFATIAMGVSYCRTISTFSRLYMDEMMEGKWSFSKSFIMGSYISFFASMLVAVAVYFYLRVMGPQAFDTMVENAAETWDALAKTEEQRAYVDQMRRTTPTDMTFSTMWSVILFGLMFTLWVSLYKKLKNK